MKKIVRMIAMLVAVVSIVSAMSVSAHAISSVSSIVTPEPTILYINNTWDIYEALVTAAYNINSKMAVIDYCEMPNEVPVKYVQSDTGTYINVYLNPMGKKISDVIRDGVEVYVFYTVGGYAFVLTEDGLVGWCKSEFLANSFDAKLSAKNNRATDARNGIFG